MTKLKTYWLVMLTGIIAASVYPLYMGIRVVYDMAVAGGVDWRNFPKYIIPYTPIALSLIVAVAILPVVFRYRKKMPFLDGALIAVAVFFLAEILLENLVVVKMQKVYQFTKLESWQMYMCMSVAEPEIGIKPAEKILLGEYSSTYKLHFYMISVVLILTSLNAIYGFAKMIESGDTRRKKALVVQSVCAALFLGLCIFACFTAFFRTGSIRVSALSAVLMSTFFILLGVTVGVYVGSYLLGKRRWICIWIPSATAGLMTIAMYIGEMCLLNGRLYRFGKGFFFDKIPGIVLSLADIAVILLSAAITAILCFALNKKTAQ